jgi:hypothetical protein
MTTMTDAFASLGATLRSPRNTYSELKDDGTGLVISCRPECFVKGLRGGARYSDNLDEGGFDRNPTGREKLRRDFQTAADRQLPIFAVCAIVSKETLDSIEGG